MQDDYTGSSCGSPDLAVVLASWRVERAMVVPAAVSYLRGVVGPGEQDHAQLLATPALYLGCLHQGLAGPGGRLHSPLEQVACLPLAWP